MREMQVEALCDHGASFVAVLEKGRRLQATQFHPEKSGPCRACMAIPPPREFRLRVPAPRPRAQAVSLARRIPPCLDTDGERVVKGVQFVNLRDAGDPAALAARYNIEGADELVVLDIAASSAITGPRFWKRFAAVAARTGHPAGPPATASLPWTKAGRFCARAQMGFTVNTAAIRDPEFTLTALAAEFGSQAVVLAIDAKRVGDHWEAFVRKAAGCSRYRRASQHGRIAGAWQFGARRNPCDFLLDRDVQISARDSIAPHRRGNFPEAVHVRR